MSTSTARVVTVAIAMSLGFAACSSGSDDAPSGMVDPDSPELSTTTSLALSLADWQREITLVCNEFEPQQAAIVAREGVPKNAKDLVVLFDALLPLADAYGAAILRIPVPSERADDVRRLNLLTEEHNRTATLLRDTAAAGDGQRSQVLADNFDAQTKEISTLLAQLAVPACITPDQ